MIRYDKYMISAGYLVYMNENIEHVKNDGRAMYNILMKEYETVRANNMLVETLHPNNEMVKVFRYMKEKEMKKEERKELLREIKKNY